MSTSPEPKSQAELEPTATPLLQASGITKRFGGVTALEAVAVEVLDGEIVALLGDNGAGKSTLVKILSGVHQMDEGTIRFEGKVVQIRNPRDAMALGVETIYQDLSLFDNLNASGNVFAGRELCRQGPAGAMRWLDKGAMDLRTKEVLGRLDVDLPDRDSPVERLSGGQRQALAIVRSVLWGRRLVLMDEPAAALGVRESEKLLTLIRSLASVVHGVMVISHNLDPVMAVADRAVVLRHGRNAGSLSFRDFPDREELRHQLVAMISGVSAAQIAVQAGIPR